MMQINGTSVLTSAETDLSATPAVLRLSYGELAVALYASDLPTRTLRGASRADLITAAAQGLARVGAELAWWTDYRSRRLAGGSWTAEAYAEYDRMWPSKARTNAAHHAASTLTCVCGPNASKTPWPGIDPRTVAVEWAGRVWPVPLADLENAARYPHRAAADPRLGAMLRAYTAPVTGRQLADLAGGAR